MHHGFIPDYLIERLTALPDEALRRSGERTARIDQRMRARSARPDPEVATADGDWQVYDAENGSDLPGTLVRSSGDPGGDDATVNEAALGLTASLALCADLGRDSYDDRGATVVATVHYEQNYDNAFWDGSQLVFGDGDGKLFASFTRPIDVLGHELAHAITEFTANLVYRDQSGALNESYSDVFGACVKQRHLGQTVEQADWLIGEGIFQPGVNGRALRSMIEPGTAYDDPQLGKDPQVGSMSDYVQTDQDNGGVHLNSGIPNRAFVLAAQTIGGEAWSGAGRIWYSALISGIPATCDFATFAEATIAAAGEHADAVRRAWETVGVLTGAADGRPDPSPTPRTPVEAEKVAVTRSGGFAGLTKRGEVDLASDDPRVPQVRRLVDRIDFGSAQSEEPQPDRYVYDFRYQAVEVERHTVVYEPDLTPELQQLAIIVLED